MKSTIAKLTAATAIALLPLGAFAATPISKVNVKADLTENVGANAMQYYPQIEEDVTRMIAERIDLTGDAGDPQIKVEIKGVLLDGDSVLPDSAEFNELVATINYTDDNGEINAETYPVFIKAMTADTPQDGVIYVAPGRDDFYQAMILALVDNVVENIPDIARIDKSK
ncbi:MULTISPECIES: hypothetical protein [Roseobacteraceae]|uniref:Uncharacterized protein n=1 Tax=Pseudosulfitobacter pseudonitzschiae TaxID=1402135 RepID=A0A221K0N1_9RHOB|nr:MULTISPECIES: hypothetical protein [Roseobacteraceae]ASM72529.1 hypothetical protein SULPSESMR1_01718 [Pseudosulfitobacter pseudonitzschiae]